MESRNKVHFSAVLIVESMQSCIGIILDSLNNHAPYPDALDLQLHAPPTLSKFYVESKKKVHFSAAVIAGSMIPCTVTILDAPNNHALRHGALKHFMLHQLCQHFMWSLEIQCTSLAVIAGHSSCAWHPLWENTMTRCPWPSHSTDFVKILCRV